MGSNAVANSEGSFVYGDASGTPVDDFGANTFTVLASNGVNLFDDGSGTPVVSISSGGIQLNKYKVCLQPSIFRMPQVNM